MKYIKLQSQESLHILGWMDGRWIGWMDRLINYNMCTIIELLKIKDKKSLRQPKRNGYYFQMSNNDTESYLFNRQDISQKKIEFYPQKD